MFFSLLERNETRRVGSSHTRAAVSDGLVGKRELSQVVTNHVRLDLNRVEILAVVDSNDGTDHLWHNNHAAQMGLDGSWLLTLRNVLLGQTELLNQTHGLALQSALELSAGTACHHLHQLLTGDVEQLLEVNTTVRKLAEGPSLVGGSVSLYKYVVISFSFRFKCK